MDETLIEAFLGSHVAGQECLINNSNFSHWNGCYYYEATNDVWFIKNDL